MFSYYLSLPVQGILLSWYPSTLQKSKIYLLDIYLFDSSLFDTAFYILSQFKTNTNVKKIILVVLVEDAFWIPGYVMVRKIVRMDLMNSTVVRHCIFLYFYKLYYNFILMLPYIGILYKILLINFSINFYFYEIIQTVKIKTEQKNL